MLFSLARKLAGPLIVVVGLNIMGFLRFNISIGEKLIDRFYSNSTKLKILNPSFTMGIFFSFAFCPTLFWLFFGIVIPLSLKSSMGLIFPMVFSIGTLVPMLLILAIMNLVKDNSGNLVKSFRKSERIIRKAGGALLIVFGIIDTIIYFFI